MGLWSPIIILDAQEEHQATGGQISGELVHATCRGKLKIVPQVVRFTASSYACCNTKVDCEFLT